MAKNAGRSGFNRIFEFPDIRRNNAANVSVIPGRRSKQSYRTTGTTDAAAMLGWKLA